MCCCTFHGHVVVIPLMCSDGVQYHFCFSLSDVNSDIWALGISSY